MDQKWFVSGIFGFLCFLNVSTSLYLDLDALPTAGNGNEIDFWDAKGGQSDLKEDGGWRDKWNESQTERPLGDGNSWLNVFTLDKLYNLTEKDKGPQNETKVIFINAEDHVRVYENGNDEDEDNSRLQESGSKNVFHLLSPEGFLSQLIPENQPKALERSKRQAEEGNKKCKCRKRVRKTMVRRRRRRRRRRYRVGQQNRPARRRRRRRGRGRRRGNRARRGRGGRRRCVCKKEEGDGEEKSEGGEPEVEEADGGGEEEGTTTEGGEEGGEAEAEGGGEEGGEAEAEGGEEEGGEEGGDEGGEEGGEEGEGEGEDEGGDEDEAENYSDEGSDEESDEQEANVPEAVAPPEGNVPDYPSVPPYPGAPAYAIPIYPGAPRPAPYTNGAEVPIAVMPAGTVETRPVPTYTIVTYPTVGALVHGDQIRKVEN